MSRMEQDAANRALLRHGFTWNVVAFSSLAATFQGYLFGLLGLDQRLLGVKVLPGLEDVPTETANWLIMFGTIIGAACSGVLASRLGRRSAAVFAARVAVIASALSALPRVSPILYLVGRAFSGTATGIFSAVVPMYQSELAPAATRGSILVTYQLAYQLGGLSAYLVIRSILLVPAITYVHGATEILFGMQGVPALFMAAVLPYLPESPRWHMLRGKFDEAKHELVRLRKGQTLVVLQELQTMRSYARIRNACWLAVTTIKSTPIWLPASTTCSLQLRHRLMAFLGTPRS